MGHIDGDLLRSVLEGQLAPRALLRILSEHLKDLCPECGANLEMLLESDEDLLRAVAGEAVPSSSERFSAAFHKAGCLAAARADDLEAERGRARLDLEELLAMPATERAPRVTSAYVRFRSRALAELLLDEIRSKVRHDPTESARLAELVPVILHGTPGAAGAGWAEEIYALSLALRGNALRVAGDLPRADAAFRELHGFVGSHPMAGDELHAELASLEASLRLEQRRLDEAELLLDRAISLYAAASAADGVAKNLIKRGEVQRLDERLDASAESLRQALAVLGPQGDPHLVLCAVGTLGLVLCDAGRAREAENLVVRHEALLRQQADGWMDLRMTFLRGRIAWALGRFDEAERRMLAARQGYLDQDLAYSAALVTLDLALLYLEHGRTAEIREAARMMMAVFEVRNVHRQTLAALVLFEQAAAAEKVSEQTIRGLRRYLERSRVDPQTAVRPS